MTRLAIPAALAAACVAVSASASELVVMDWNPRTITKGDHGFPTERNDIDNSDWTQPVDYAHGKLYHRLELRSMPTSKHMSWQYCFHQDGITLENCGTQSPYFDGPDGGDPVVVTWSSDIASMWKLDGIPIDWSEPRSCAFVAIRKSANQYISDYSSLNGGVAWAGEDPDEWYPMEVRFTVVVVSAGGTFSGWDNYTGGGGTPNEAPTAHDQSVSVREGDSTSVTLDYSDPDGAAPYAFTIVGGPSHGTLSGSGGSRTYTPDAGYAGTDSFTWKVADDEGDQSNVATVTITVQANAPPVAQDGAASVVEGSSVSITLNYTDSDGPGPYTFSITQGPSHGTLSGSGGSRSYTPDGSFSGTDTFTWKVNDGSADSNTATVTIEVSGDVDGDLLPDWWETLYGLDPNETDSDGDGVEDGLEDEDEDGWNNYQEYVAGSDPNVADTTVAAGGNILSCGAGGGALPSLALALVVLATLSLRPGRRRVALARDRG